MRPSYRLLCSVGLLGAVGCATAGRPSQGMRPFRTDRALTIRGIVAESPNTPGEYAFASFDRTGLGVGAEPFYKRLPVRKPGGSPEPMQVIKQALKVHIRQINPDFDFQALLGPPLCLAAGRPRFCSSRAGEGKIVDENGAPAFFLTKNGWVFLWSNPDVTRAKSRWVSAGSEGSSMVLQVVDGTLQRVFFLSGDHVWVTCREDAKTKHFLRVPRTYFEIRRGCAVTGPFNIDAAGTAADIKTFIREVENMVQVADQ